MNSKIDKIINNITGSLDAAADNDNNNGNNNNEGPMSYSEDDRQRYQDLKRRYEFHREFENRDGDYGTRYLPNNTDSGGFAKYEGEHCQDIEHGGCVLYCPFWVDPELGYMSEKGIVYYENPDMSEEFWGTDNAIEARKRIAAMTAEEYEKYKRELTYLDTLRR